MNLALLAQSCWYGYTCPPVQMAEPSAALELFLCVAGALAIAAIIRGRRKSSGDER